MQKYFGIKTPVDYVFDEKGDAGAEALLWYSATKDAQQPDIRNLMGSTPVFKSDEEVLPLQAADLVAWRYRRLLEGREDDPELAATMRLDEIVHGEFPMPNSMLDHMASEILKVPGVAESKHLPSIYQTLKRAHRKLDRRNAATSKGERDEQ
jgi:hypothetical protein